MRELLSELGRATTAYYETTPDRLEQARREYEEALRKFDATSELAVPDAEPPSSMSFRCSAGVVSFES